MNWLNLWAMFEVIGEIISVILVFIIFLIIIIKD